MLQYLQTTGLAPRPTNEKAKNVIFQVYCDSNFYRDPNLDSYDPCWLYFLDPDAHQLKLLMLDPDP
jgi:hypothetical protein